MYRHKILHFNGIMKLEDIDEKLEGHDDDLTIVFIKEGCHTTVGNINHIIEKIDILLETHDIFYLSNVMDSCSKHFDIIDEFNGLKVYLSKSPNGFYCTAAKKRNWKKVIKLLNNTYSDSISSGLNNLVVTKQITALTSWPRIYNPGNTYDFHPCRDESVAKSKTSPEYEMSVYYFMISCLILTIFLATFHKYS